MNYKMTVSGGPKFFLAAISGLFFLITAIPAQKFWLTTYEFPGGPKVGLTLSGDSCLFAGIRNGIIRSCNDGFHFDQVLGASAIYTVYSAGSGEILAGGPGKIFFSVDSGHNWDSITLDSNYPVTQFLENHSGGLFAITGTLDPERGYVGSGVYYSENGRSDWEKRNQGLGSYLCCDRIAMDRNGRLYLAVSDEYNSGNGGLFISEDNGKSWEHIDIRIDGKNTIPDDIQAGQTFGLSVSPDDSLYFSFTGSADNVAVDLNLVIDIREIGGPGFWR